MKRASDAEPATVLVIDDHEEMRRLLRRMLIPKYRVIVAEGVSAGLAVITEEAVDLVLMDVNMPGINGLDGCRSIKAAALGFLPVLLLTGMGNSDEDVVAGLEAGADDFLTKPIGRRELELRVATFVRLRRQELQIQEQLDELRRLMNLKDDMIGGLVHDLRTPLAAVLSTFNLLSKTVTDAEMQEDVRLGLSSAKRVLELADDLLLVRLLEEGKLGVNLESCAPMSVVMSAVETLQQVAEESRVKIATSGPNDFMAALDSKLVRRAVENLLSNAVKYTEESVDVEVSARPVGFEIAVADRGRGIPDEFKPTLFEKYGSVEARKGNARRGVGLGLYMVRLVAAAHGGEMLVEDRVGGGTVFRLRLCTKKG